MEAFERLSTVDIFGRVGKLSPLAAVGYKAARAGLRARRRRRARSLASERNSDIELAIKMAIHELLYFPVTALGEPIRLALAIGGVEFKNTTTRNDDTFHERKKSLSPLGEAGQVPILVLPDGKALCQSRAIRGGRRPNCCARPHGFVC